MAEKKAFPLRLDPALYEAIRRWADAEFRSVNGQIEYLLQQAVEQRKKGNKDPKSGDAR
ncbi:MAG: toxin-antitoxin system HicB family antitoxin [Candidatus Eisenbacteria bacterium]|nr:toxin-antitoxin system HicB family antitoxin [Candidatus Eisenbacteria bacterium]